MSFLHAMFGQHVPKVAFNHWEGGHFVSRCEICDCVIVRLPGLPWRLADDQGEAADGPGPLQGEREPGGAAKPDRPQ